jgi:hypothetical protein
MSLKVAYLASGEHSVAEKEAGGTRHHSNLICLRGYETAVRGNSENFFGVE